MLSGELDVQAGFYTIAHSGGWPIQTDGGFLFAYADDGQTWSLAGDHNNWALEPMTLENGIWWLEVSIDAPSGSLYKFVDQRDDYIADPWARAYGYDAFGEYSLVRGAGDHIERWPAVTDGTMPERTVRVWVPRQPTTHQIYVHDGQNLFDPQAIWGGWRLQESLGPSTMAIGIDNTWDRMGEYTHTEDLLHGTWYGGQGDAYAALVEETIRPLIEAEYGAADAVGVMGSSLGGLISFHQILVYPGAYDFAASLSGTFGWGRYGADNQTMIELHAAAGHGPTALYVDSGGDVGPGGCSDPDGDGIQEDAPGVSDNYCVGLQMADTLEAAGYTYELDLWHWWDAGAEHNEWAWSNRVDLPLGIFEGL